MLREKAFQYQWWQQLYKYLSKLHIFPLNRGGPQNLILRGQWHIQIATISKQFNEVNMDEVKPIRISIYSLFLSLPESFLTFVVFKKKEEDPAMSTSYWISTSQLIFLIEIIPMETIKNNNYTKQP